MTNYYLYRFLGVLLWMSLPLLVSAQADSSQLTMLSSGNEQPKQPISQWVTPANKTLSERLPIVGIRQQWEENDIAHILQNSRPSLQQARPIEPTYYRDNIFAIEESDNPFALRRSNRPRAALVAATETKSSSFWKELTELFSSQDKSNIPTGTPGWLLFVLLGALGFFATMMTVFRQDIFKIFAAFINSTTAGQLYRDQRNDLFTPIGMSSYTLFSVVLGSFLFLSVDKLSPSEVASWNSFGAFSLTVLGVMGIFALKHLQIKLVGLVFPFRHEMDFYNFLLSNHNKLIGIVFLPLVFLLAYMPASMQVGIAYLGLSILVAMYFYRGFRAMAASSDWILAHKFHFFVYLCSVEIAPALILAKLLAIL